VGISTCPSKEFGPFFAGYLADWQWKPGALRFRQRSLFGQVPSDQAVVPQDQGRSLVGPWSPICTRLDCSSYKWGKIATMSSPDEFLAF